MKKNWAVTSQSLWKNIWTLRTKAKYLEGFNEIGDYHGTKIGFFYAFYAHYTSWL